MLHQAPNFSISDVGIVSKGHDFLAEPTEIV